MLQRSCVSVAITWALVEISTLLSLAFNELLLV